MNEDRLAKVLGATLSTPNEADSNGEAANVVDGLFAIARELGHLADVIGRSTATDIPFAPPWPDGPDAVIP